LKCQKNVKEVSTVVKSDEIVCYLQMIMNKYSKYLINSLVVFALFLSVLSCSKESNNNFSEIVKVSLRDVGHHLLINNQDSTSLVKPIVVLEELKYQLSFEEELSIDPDRLVTLVKNSFQKGNLAPYYLVEVLQCEDNEVAYSYEVKESVEKGIIPCRGRELHKGCYRVNVRFTKDPGPNKSYSWLVYIVLFGILGLVAFVFYKRKLKIIPIADKGNYTAIGRYRFYPELNKLVKEVVEISLTKKECELLAIFVANPNQIIKRDEISKKIWEDNGVFVGRSLDTYISKLRKKLQDDDSIKLTNVHGIGYMLEIKA